LGPSPASWISCLVYLINGGPSNCSDLAGSKQLAAFQEWIKAPGPPGAEEGCQGHPFDQLRAGLLLVP
jgi:hypothetical protein